MPLWGITPHGVGKLVGWRCIEPGWELTPEETFSLEADQVDETLVLAEDEASLREPTAEELAEQGRPEIQPHDERSRRDFDDRARPQARDRGRVP